MLDDDEEAVDEEEGEPFEARSGDSSWNGLGVGVNGLSVMEDVDADVAYYYNGLFRKFFL